MTGPTTCCFQRNSACNCYLVLAWIREPAGPLQCNFASTAGTVKITMQWTSWSTNPGQHWAPLGPSKPHTREVTCRRACRTVVHCQSMKAACSYYGVTAPAGLYFTVGDVWLAGTEVFALAALWVTALAAAELASWVSGA